jgi:hypothetical protein
MEFFVVALGLCIVVWVFASSRGRSGFGWFCLSLIISPLVAGLLVLVLPNRTARSVRLPNAPDTPGIAVGHRRLDPPPLRR